MMTSPRQPSAMVLAWTTAAVILDGVETHLLIAAVVVALTTPLLEMVDNKNVFSMLSSLLHSTCGSRAFSRMVKR